MNRWDKVSYTVFCSLLALFFALGQGACGEIPGGAGALTDGPLRFLPDPDGGTTDTTRKDDPRDNNATQDQRAKDTAIPDQRNKNDQNPTPELPKEPQTTEQKTESTPEKMPETTPETPGNTSSWIGGPCSKDSDCDYKDGVCLTAKDGYPDGNCTLPCTRLCPDKDGQPGTFCVDLKAKISGGGGCISRCDYQAFPSTGCRKGYHCAAQTRFKETNTKADACIPGKAPPHTGNCYQQLAKAGVSFTPRSNPMAKPAGHPNLTCSVVDAVSVHPPIHGVDWVTGGNKRSSMFMRCSLALAMAKFSLYLKSRGVVKAMHYGTYSCRTIRNDSGSTNKLSRHGLGDAIDLAAFWDKDGKLYSLVKHWDHSTTWKQNGVTGCHSTTFNSPEAKLLYEIGCAMWKQKIFSLVLTPNYNKVHDDHFHVDLGGSGSVLSLPSHIGTHNGQCQHQRHQP